jgi:hypothetical protein
MPESIQKVGRCQAAQGMANKRVTPGKWLQWPPATATGIQ